MRLDPDIVRQQIANLLVSDPELAEDEILRADMIEGETDAILLLEVLAEEIGQIEAMVEGVEDYQKRVTERRNRLDRRAASLRLLIFKIMNTADLKKIELPAATLSIRNGQQKLVGEADPNSLPDQYVKITRTVDRVKVKEAIQGGATVEGFQLSNAEPSLTIRTK